MGLRTESPLLHFYDSRKCKEGWGIDSLFKLVAAGLKLLPETLS